MTFIGESIELYYARTMPDNEATGDGLRLRDDGSTQTLAAGDDIMVNWADYDQLEADSDAVFSLVFVGLSGSASIHVTYGTDPDWNPTTADATIDAGTFTVGVGETVVSLPGWNVADYHATDELHTVRLQVDSGSVVLDQVRLRIWPPGGYVGGWSSTVAPGEPVGPFDLTGRYRAEPVVDQWTADPGVIPPGSFDRIERPTDDDRGQAFLDAQTYARGDFEAVTEAYTRLDDLTTGFASTIVRASGEAHAARYEGEEITNDPVGSTAGAEVYGERAYMPRATTVATSPVGVRGVDWWVHPDRVDGETGARKEMVGGGDSYTWAQGTVTIGVAADLTVGSYAMHLPGAYYLKVGGLEEVPAGMEDTAVLPFAPMTTAGGTVVMNVPDDLTSDSFYSATYALPDIDEPVVTFELSHDILYGPADYVPAYDYVGDPDFPQLRAGAGSAVVEGGIFSDFDEGVRDGYEPLSYYLTPGPYRYWVADPRVRKLRQRLRDDIRSRDRASRQRGIRQRGYL